MKIPILKLILVTAIFSVSISLFILMAHELFSENEYDFDNTVLHYVSTHIPSPTIVSGMSIISFFASGNFLAGCYICLFTYFLIKRRLLPALYILSTGLSGFLVNALLKILFHRQRPADPLIVPPNDFSFPSGHSSAAFIFYGLLIYLLWQTALPTRKKIVLSVFLVVFSIVIGFSRVYLRVHYATDVLAGFCVGAAWLSLSFFLYGQWNGKFPDKHQPG